MKANIDFERMKSVGLLIDYSLGFERKKIAQMAFIYDFLQAVGSNLHALLGQDLHPIDQLLDPTENIKKC